MISAKHFFRSRAGAVIFAMNALMGPSLLAQQNTGELDVGVRTEVEPQAKFKKKVKGQPLVIAKQLGVLALV